ncbi:uncharacterized protein Dwil_GK11854 [Drosophila willistoni]|uniref:Gamma-interferon-inducible lysosomal thiol reductase n=1 Tax=Drosophila willistoni TaxID=7260 RepID=B4NB96_DROWI|nr:GILT-like protein 1 [Drosophila willistoni]EDW81060.1 uncharacterized protein Dwil_GK11854 [Drosophila willistoni]
MFRFLKTLSFLLIGLSFCLTKSEKILRVKRQANKLHITLLYESLCPDSRNFMDQLGPVYEELHQFLDIDLVPFGKSESRVDPNSNEITFRCQHGPPECQGNRLQSCVLNSTKNQAAQVKFVICQMLALDYSSVDQCAREANILTDVDNCVNSETGTKLQLQAELVTKLYQPTFIPTIVYNGVFNRQLQEHSLRNFRATVCYMLRQQNLLSPDESVCQ